MKEKLDYRIIRAFPYVVFSLYLIIIVALLLLSFTVLIGSSSERILFLGTRSGVALTFRVLEYVALVALELILYRMMRESRYFAIAYNVLLGYMIADLVYRVASWICDFYDNTATYIILAFIRLLPETFMLFGIYYMIKAFAALYVKMKKKKIVEDTKRLATLWISAHSIFIVISIVLLPVLFAAPEAAKKLFLMLYISATVYYIVVAVLIYIRTKDFCYDYYMYRYNAKEVE